MDAKSRLIAIGPYMKCVEQYLDYPPSFYKECCEGERIIVNVLYCDTTDMSEELSACFDWGGDLIPTEVDIQKYYYPALEGFGEEHGKEEEMSKALQLSNHGFSFYFMPECS